MQQTRFFFPMIFLLGEEAIPKRAGYTGSWPKTGAIHANTTITAVYTKDSGIVIPPQPTSPGEIMSGGEGEPVENAPIEADAPAEDETVAPQGMHVTGTQTVTHEYLTLNGKVARETIKTNDSLTAVLDGPMVKRRPPVYILPCSGSGSWMHIGMRSQPRIKIRSSREPAKDETFIFSRFRIYQYIVVSVLHLAEIVFHHALSAHCSHKAHLQRRKVKV